MKPAAIVLRMAFLVVAAATGAAHAVLTETPPVPLVALHGVERAADRIRSRIRDTLEAAETLPMMAERFCFEVKSPYGPPLFPKQWDCPPLREALEPIEEP